MLFLLIFPLGYAAMGRGFDGTQAGFVIFVSSFPLLTMGLLQIRYILPVHGHVCVAVYEYKKSYVELFPVMNNCNNVDHINAPLLLRTCIQFGSFRTEIIRMHLFFMGIYTLFRSKISNPFSAIKNRCMPYVICEFFLYCRI
jgi:hypothetical protein